MRITKVRGSVSGRKKPWLELVGPREPIVIRGRAAPQLCLIHALTGYRCPGCGMTRAVLYLLRGRVTEAVQASAVMPFVVLAAGMYAVAARSRRETGMVVPDLTLKVPDQA